MDIKKARIFAEVVDGGTYSQFCNIIKNDEVVDAVLLPDCHKGYSLPIGSVVAVKEKVFPCFVGYDIGCGMCAVKTTYKKQDIIKHANKIWEGIQNVIPTGFKHNSVAQEWPEYSKIPKTPIAEEIFNKNDTGFKQLGTLGGGNHFIEIGFDEEDNVWVIIHSGSRGIGHDIATYYMRLAGGGRAREGYFGFAVNSEEAQQYIADLNFALEFALANRKLMLKKIKQVLDSYCAGDYIKEWFINRNHNHAEIKDHPEFGEVWIHRKGATHAEKDMLGVIPGNMRDGSFIVKGKGNIKSLWSSSHGAGRVLGRKEAKEKIDLKDFKETMGNIVANINLSTLDESPFAYKNIFDVMEAQKDLVEIVAYVKPLINVKG